MAKGMNQKESILIVDDDESSHRSLTLIFGRKGYETETAATGREAIDKAQRRFFNLALLDIKLPDMEGLELLAPLKHLHPDMVVIMVTAYASTKTAIRALSEGASAYIIKPLDMDEVLATVKQALENQCLVEEKRQAREALRKAHDELEQRVEERTAKLAKTTQQLKVELTERKQAEEALSLAHMELKKKAADLELANQELSEYNYIVAHVLKAPLRAIRNYADFLREDFRAILGGDQKAYFEGLDRAVAQGVELVEDLLEFSRVGRRSVPTQAIDVGIFLEELIASLALSPDVEVVMGNDWPTIDTDPSLLKEIFHVLIRNAIKFNHASHKRMEIGWFPAGEDHYELFVRDNGIGIDPRYHEQIFGVFQRLHSREEYEGTGLGLAIVKKAVSKLSGSLRVESKIGEGSTFFVAIPKTQRQR
jgi:light-regulated signal transduction histidine kinase (bacteriophytochrome)